MHNGLFEPRDLKYGRYVLYVALPLVLSGCNPEKQWELHTITGYLRDLRFSLMPDAQQAVTDQTCRSSNRTRLLLSYWISDMQWAWLG
ncbi:MAG: hypothetical protein Q7T96_13690 [Methylobacter sp.]|uniref:hypothetical protein n=1 Tax=Methylobacter sp. TaxID=2051955 RepID=UPI00271E1CBD|nr:hypothetical protein [Methylobacter sp.]MDO9270153.1 hypothetical protein [Methylobacter sp.]MDP1664941.1 hypothetical protein [Methylobacter sp.]